LDEKAEDKNVALFLKGHEIRRHGEDKITEKRAGGANPPCWGKRDGTPEECKKYSFDLQFSVNSLEGPEEKD